MRFPFFLFIFLIFFIVPVFATSTTMRQTPAPTLPVLVDSSSDILPLVVSVKKSPRELQTSFAATESTRIVQREKYAQLQKRILNASASEQPLLHAQISQQRQRVLLSTLNALIVLYQRADYLVNQFDAGLLSVRSKYNSTKNLRPVASFDSRIRELDITLASLRKRSVVLSQNLSQASSSVNLDRDLVALKAELSSFLKDTEAFSAAYRSLAQDVVSRR